MSSRTARFAFPFVLAVVYLAGCSGEQQGGTVAMSGMFVPSEPFAICEHKRFPWTEWDCPDTQFLSLADVDSISLVVKMKNGTIRVTPILPVADAIFLSKMATDSILVRYYQSIGDSAKVRGLRSRLQSIP